jgi:hypothetical protein
MLQANPFTTWTLIISWFALGVCITYALALRKRVIELDGGHVVRDQVRGVYGYSG